MVDLSAKRTILIAGTPFIKRVDAEIALDLREKGFDSVFYTPKGIKGVNPNSFRDERTPANPFLAVWNFFKLLREIRPHHVELYISSPYSVLPFYAVLTRVLGCSLVIWCRGGELFYWGTRHGFFRRTVVRFCFRMANYLLVKEAYMPQQIRRLGLARPEQIIELPNRVQVHPEYTLERSSTNVLFLNSPKPWRHIELLADVIPLVAKSIPEVRFWFVGSRTEQEMDYVRSEMHRTGAGPWVEIRPYEPEVRQYYEQAALFILPADLVWVNHSLLEAMERGVPPIVANVDVQAGNIVEHDISGLILPLDSKSWADAIVALLRDEPRRQALGGMARKKIQTDFDVQDKVRDLIGFYETCFD